MLNSTQKVLLNKNIKMYVTSEAKKYILSKGTDIKYGARPLRRAVQRYVEDELSDMILKGELLIGQNIHIDFNKKENKLTFLAK